MSNETVPPDGEPDTAGIEAAKQAIYESMPVVLKDLVARSEAEAAIGVPHGAGVPDRWLADVAVRAYLAAGRAAADEPWREAIAFINWFVEGPCGCDGDPQDPCDSCRALALLTRLDDLAGRAVASPDPPRTVLDPETGIEEPVTTGRIPDAEFVEPPLMPPAASPDPPETWECCGQTFTGGSSFISGARCAHICKRVRKPITAEEWSEGQPQASTAAVSPDPPTCRCPDDWRYDDGSVFCPRHSTKPDAPAPASPDPPNEDAIRADERERLSARVYENGWCGTCGRSIEQ